MTEEERSGRQKTKNKYKNKQKLQQQQDIVFTSPLPYIAQERTLLKMTNTCSFCVTSAICLLICMNKVTHGFAPGPNNVIPVIQQKSINSVTVLQAKKKVGGSMAQKRKKRGKKFIPKPMERPKVLDEVPRADMWEKTVSTDDQVQIMTKGEEETKAKATALVDSQRKSVEILTKIRTQIENLPVNQILDAMDGKYIVFDDVLGEDLCNEIAEEGQSMFDNNKMELDLNAGITSGEYGVAIKGGKEQYVDCPRSVEYVVSTSRHLTGMMNKASSGEDGVVSTKSLSYKLDETASMAGWRLFNRKARVSSLTLLTGNDNAGNDTSDLEKKPFGFVVDQNSNEVDMRKVTAIYYTTPTGWDEDCGGGVTFQDADGSEEHVRAKNDRLLLFSSDESAHRLESWIGKEGIDGISGYIVAHLVRKRQ